VLCKFDDYEAVEPHAPSSFDGLLGDDLQSVDPEHGVRSPGRNRVRVCLPADGGCSPWSDWSERIRAREPK
jgi:hypothetical protein